MVSPEKRLHYGRILFWSSLIGTPPALVVTYLWPTVGVLILQAVSFLALTLTAWDIVQTADVRDNQ